MGSGMGRDAESWGNRKRVRRETDMKRQTLPETEIGRQIGIKPDCQRDGLR